MVIRIVARAVELRPMCLLLGFALTCLWTLAEPTPSLAQTKSLKNANPAQQKKQNQKQQQNKSVTTNKPVAAPAPRSSLLTPEAWQKAPLTPVRKGEIDQLVAKELEKDKIQPAPITTDEQFVRRVTLDLTGQLPLPADISEFVSSTDPEKRPRLIDKLLGSEEYARHWARYWKDVIAARLNDRRGLALQNAFEEWLAAAFKENRPWDKIVRDMLTAAGEAHYDAEEGKNGQAFFLAAHRGNDAANEQAAETARVFLGIQIQCAQCHDHPSDQWKRVQFHEFAAYFARVREAPIRGENGKPGGIRLISNPRGEHEMPSKEDPKKTLLTHPRFLDGNSPGKDLPDSSRRSALAAQITAKSNYWFAGAYANRIWGELMGQAFYQPVDDMGPQKEVVFPGVLTRLTGAFRGTNYDIKQMFRAIMNTETYQRQIRLGEASDQHLHFAAAYPTRLRADALWDSLTSVLGPLHPSRDQVRQRNPNAPPGMRAFGFEGLFKEEFNFDPSLKADEVESSVSQALMLMNNPALNQKMRANGTNLLARVLTSYPEDDEAVQMVYLRTLARKPTDKELATSRGYIRSSGNRREAFEDLLWALINSTEFQTKR